MKQTRIWILSLLLMLPGCGAEPPTGPFNILLISIDTLRQDHVGCYDYDRETTPNLDELARQGTVFENAVSTSCWTLPAHASLLTGLYPAFHGLQDDGAKLPEGIPTVAGQLSQLDYFTLAVVSHVYVSSEFGLERGFELFDDSLIEGGEEIPIAAEVVTRTLEQMAGIPAGPFFCFVHFYDPHWDYSPPPPFDTKFTDPGYDGPIDGTLNSLMPYLAGGRPMPRADLQRAIDLYDGEIAYVDAEIGRMLDGLRAQGRLENTVVIVTSDHGEEFREHGRLGHQKSLFWEQLRVPLIVAGHPDFPAGQRRDDLVSLVDVPPLLTELTGAEPLPVVQGTSLLEREIPRDRIVFAESIRFGNEMRAARQLGHKAIHNLQGDMRFFFDLAKDPREMRPLRLDPTDGKLSAALADYAMVADSGWHLKVISLTTDPLHCRGTLRTTGRFLSPRRYFSAHLQKPSEASFREFGLSEDQQELTFDLDLTYLMGEFTFTTEPPDAPVTFEIEVESEGRRPGVFLGAGTPVPGGETIELVRSDPRLTGLPRDYVKAPPGCYIRSVVAPVEAGERVNLSRKAIEQLEALGY